MSEEQKTVEQEEQSPKDLVQQDLKELDSRPPQEQIDEWKVKHGEVFCSGFSNGELAIWRAITRKEWVELQEFAANPDNAVTELMFEELICQKCTLWTSTPGLLTNKAGTVVTLKEQILGQSNFVLPHIASQMVVKL